LQVFFPAAEVVSELSSSIDIKTDIESQVWNSAEKLKVVYRNRPLVVPPFKEPPAPKGAKKGGDAKKDAKTNGDAKPAAAAAAAAGGKGLTADQKALEAQKDKVRELKAAKASKEEITAAVAELNRLKEVCGESVPAPKGGKKDSVKEAAPARAKKEGGKDSVKAAEGGKKQSTSAPAPAPAASSGPAKVQVSKGLDDLHLVDEMGQKIRDYIEFAQRGGGSGKAKFTFPATVNYSKIFIPEQGKIPLGHTDFSFNGTVYSKPHDQGVS